MRKALIFVIACLALASALSPSEAAEDIDVSVRALNTTPLYGPEGLVLTPDGSAYVGEHDGRIRRVGPGGEVEEFANLNDLPGHREKRIGAVGLAMDRNGDIYAATLKALGGAVLKVVGPGKPDAGTPSLYRNGINSANFILIDDETETMYVSDSSPFSGGVYRFDMSDESRVGTAVDPEKNLLGKFSYANGLALGPEKKFLYVAETTKGRVSRIDLANEESEVFADIGGWADGLACDAARELLFVCDNRGGRIVALDLSGNLKGEVRLIGKEGQCAPACLGFRDPNTIVYTDLWKASLFAALIGRPEYHSYIYEVSVAEVLK